MSSRPGRLSRLCRLPTSTPWESITLAPSSCFRLFSRSVTPVLTCTGGVAVTPLLPACWHAALGMAWH